MNQSLPIGAAAQPTTLGGRILASADPSRRRGVADLAAVVIAAAAYLALIAAAWWAVSTFVPDHLTLSLFGRSHDVKAVHERIFGAGILMFLVLPAALWIEGVCVGWAASSARRLIVNPTASNKTDIAYFLVGQTPLLGVLGKVLTLGASLLSGMWVHDQIAARFGLSPNLDGLPMPAQVAAYFFAYTFFDYWTHRLDHSRYFWPLHRYHHAAEEFCVITAGRSHPASFTFIFLINIPMAILGATPSVMIDVNVLTIALGFVIHSRIDSNFGWVGRWLIQSPNHHRLHHVLDISVTPVGHFGMSPIWDHLFGTWRGEADQSLVIGVDTPYRHGFWLGPDMVRDYWHFWRGFLPIRRPAVRID